MNIAFTVSWPFVAALVSTIGAIVWVSRPIGYKPSKRA